MAYNYQNFLRPISSEDRNIQVIDSVGKIKYTINAFHIVNIVVSNNIIKINLKSNKVISLDFNTNNEAREALAFLQTQVDGYKAQLVPKDQPDFKEFQVQLVSLKLIFLK